jgi:hypothetical protein
MVISFSKLSQSFRNHFFASTPFKNFEIAYQRPIKAPPPIMAKTRRLSPIVSKAENTYGVRDGQPASQPQIGSTTALADK